MKQSGLFGLSDHLKRLSANGDPLEELVRIVDSEGFRVMLESALAYSEGSKGGRPPYDCVAMFKILILAAQNNVADARMEYLIRDRLADDFPMCRRRLTFPLSLFGGGLLIAPQFIDYLALTQYGLTKTALWVSGFFVMAATLTLRLRPRMWK